MDAGFKRRTAPLAVVRGSITLAAALALITDIAKVHGWLWLSARVANAVVFVVAVGITVGCWARDRAAQRRSTRSVS